MCDSRIFWKKSPSGKKSSKMAQNMVFGRFKKIKSLVLSEIFVKSKFLWFINILWRLHACEKSSSQVKGKNGSQLMRFNQYFTNRLISDFDFWHVDRHEWKKQGSLTGFVKKILIWGNVPSWAQKLHILITLDPLEEFFKNFAQWKGLIGRWEWY